MSSRDNGGPASKLRFDLAGDLMRVIRFEYATAVDTSTHARL